MIDAYDAYMTMVKQAVGLGQHNWQAMGKAVVPKGLAQDVIWGTSGATRQNLPSANAVANLAQSYKHRPEVLLQKAREGELKTLRAPMKVPDENAPTLGFKQGFLDTESRNPLNQVTAAGAAVGAVGGAALVHKAVSPLKAMAKDEGDYLRNWHKATGTAMKPSTAMRVGASEGLLGHLHSKGLLAGAAAGAVIGAVPGAVMALGNKFGDDEH